MPKLGKDELPKPLSPSEIDEIIRNLKYDSERAELLRGALQLINRSIKEEAEYYAILKHPKLVSRLQQLLEKVTDLETAVTTADPEVKSGFHSALEYSLLNPSTRDAVACLIDVGGFPWPDPRVIEIKRNCAIRHGKDPEASLDGWMIYEPPNPPALNDFILLLAGLGRALRRTLQPAKLKRGAPGRRYRNLVVAHLGWFYLAATGASPPTTAGGPFFDLCYQVLSAMEIDTAGLDKAIPPHTRKLRKRTKSESPNSR
jgi:hypothetical protein